MSVSRLAQALFEPKTVALSGASGDAKKNTSRPQRFLRKHGYKGWVSLEFEGKEDYRIAIPKSLELLRKAFSVRG